MKLKFLQGHKSCLWIRLRLLKTGDQFRSSSSPLPRLLDQLGKWPGQGEHGVHSGETRSCWRKTPFFLVGRPYAPCDDIVFCFALKPQWTEQPLWTPGVRSERSAVSPDALSSLASKSLKELLFLSWAPHHFPGGFSVNTTSSAKPLWPQE